MDEKIKNDVFYFCALIEFIARRTKNRRSTIIQYFSVEAIKRQLQIAEVNHCLPFEQVADELIEDYRMTGGDFDTVSECRYRVPTYLSIGKLYQRLVLSVCPESGELAQTILDVFSSFISDEISDFNSNVYYSNPDYLRCSYMAGEMLA